MNKKVTFALSLFLITVFGFFSVGVPVVQYLCPMMSSENPTCDMSPTANATGTTFSSQTPDCCTKQLGAERNTTPFLKVEKLQTVFPDFSTAYASIVESVFSESSVFSSTAVPPYSSSSLFDLHAALLI